jgi:hypothetical protein
MHRQQIAVDLQPLLPLLLFQGFAMTSKTLIAAAALSLASSLSFAAAFEFHGDGYEPASTAVSQKTRAEVIAELKASQQRMDYARMGGELTPRDQFMSTRSVADVKAEAAARRVAVMTLSYGESSL